MATTTLTTDRDIDYIQKDFDSAVDAMTTYATVNFGGNTSANRLWTDFNADSFSRNWLEIVAFISDVLFFYFDNQATQTYLQTATVRSAVEDIAEQFGFTPATASSASGTAIFTVTGAGTIPRGFKVSSSDGQQFFVTNDIIAAAAGEVSGSVLQGTIVNESFIAEGLQSEEFSLVGPNAIIDSNNSNSQDISPQVVVNGNDYTLVDSFLRFNGTDQPAVIDSLGDPIGGGGRVYDLDSRPDNTPFITFGDGVFGRKLTAGETVSTTYRTGGGSAGNISAGALATLVDSLAFVSSVRNDDDFSGGADEQTIEQLRDLIPASLRTLERAVAEQDYSDILIANFTEVFDASTEKNTTDAAVDLNIYVVPQGSGIQLISDNPLLSANLSNYIDRRKMVTVQFQILDAYGIDCLVGLEIFINDTASQSTVRQSVITALLDYFNLETGGPVGAGIGFAEPILLKDISNLIDDIEGIDRFEIKILTYKPRVDQNVVGLTAEYINSDVTIFPNVQELEWLSVAAGQVTETAGTVLYSNDALTAFTYISLTGLISYAFDVDLSDVSPGDLFRDTSDVDYAIFAVDIVNSTLTLAPSLGVDDSAPTNNGHGSVRNGATTFESSKCFKKILGSTTNLSTNSITDNNLDLSIKSGTAVSLAARILLDNTQVFIPGEYSSGEYYLVDSVGNIWEIVDNDSNTLTTSITAVNDAAVTTAAAGDYDIVTKLVGSQIVFNDSIFNIQYNNVNTLFSIGAQFNQIGTIGDQYQISEEQANIGNIGIALDLISYDSGTGEIILNEAPSLQGVNSNYNLIDSSGQIFNVTGVDNRSHPLVDYDIANHSDNFLLEGVGLGSQGAQGFKVSTTATYPVVSFNLKREGNIVGNLTARIVNDDGGGLPDLSSPVATTNALSVNVLSETAFNKVGFTFTTPPSLSSGTQYHLVISPDSSYASSEVSGLKTFDNTGLVGFTYNSLSGVIQYASAVTLSNVLPGHFFQDSAGNLFKILEVDDSGDSLTLASGLSVDVTAPTVGDDGAVIQNDRVLVAVDDTAPTYTDGEFSRYDGVNWSNSASGPSQFPSTIDAVFSVEGTKTITVESNLTPALGPGATVSERYYDDDNQVSLILGISSGLPTSATDADATAKGTIGGTGDTTLDHFIFRTSRYSDDIVNLRLNEIPELAEEDINIDIFGGTE